MVWLKFLACLVVILFSGVKLAKYGDYISIKTGLGRLWIGVLLIAAITSTPEMIAGISSVALVKLPNLAVGDFLGSCCFNLTIIAILDIFSRNKPVLSLTSRRQVVTASLGILLLTLTALAIVISIRFPAIRLGWIGIPTIILAGVYLYGMRRVFLLEQYHQMDDENENAEELVPIKNFWWRFAMVTVAIIGASIWLSFVGKEIATTYSWSTSFVGSLFLAFSTSVPEIVVSLAALRLGAVDMAVGDILGANMLNIANLFLADIFYFKGPVLSDVSTIHVATALIGLLMTLTVIVGMLFPREHKLFRVFSWYSPLLVLLYMGVAYTLFASGA